MLSFAPSLPMAQVVLQAAELASGDEVGNYVIRAVVGRGGWGTVYLAEHPTIGRRVAIKLLRADLCRTEEALSRFFTEARAANAIKSDHVVEVIDFGQLPAVTAGGRPSFGQPYLIMEWLEGSPLGKVIETDGRLALPRALRIARQIARGLAVAHRAGIVHRDLKPDNVFLQHRESDPEFVKILDFGIAKFTSAEGLAHRTSTGTAMGTPLYMSPEQCEGARAVDHRSDIYSLGIMLYEMTSGVRPFRAEGVGALLIQQMKDVPESPRTHAPSLPATLEALIMRMLEKTPDARPQQMEQVVEALTQLGAEVTREASPSSPSASPAAIPPAQLLASGGPLERAPLTVPRWVLLLGGAAIAVGAGVGVLAARGGPDQPPAPVEKAATTPEKIAVERIQAVPPAAPAIARLSIRSEPQGAGVVELRSDGTRLSIGQTPIELERPRGSGPRTFLIELAGHRPETRVLATDADSRTVVALVRDPRPRAASKPGAALPSATDRLRAHGGEPEPPAPRPAAAEPRPKKAPKPRLDEQPTFLGGE